MGDSVRIKDARGDNGFHWGIPDGIDWQPISGRIEYADRARRWRSNDSVPRDLPGIADTDPPKPQDRSGMDPAIVLIVSGVI